MLCLPPRLPPPGWRQSSSSQKHCPWLEGAAQPKANAHSKKRFSSNGWSVLTYTHPSSLPPFGTTVKGHFSLWAPRSPEAFGEPASQLILSLHLIPFPRLAHGCCSNRPPITFLQANLRQRKCFLRDSNYYAAWWIITICKHVAFPLSGRITSLHLLTSGWATSLTSSDIQRKIPQHG